MLKSSRAYKASEIVSEAYRLCFAKVRPVCEKAAVTFFCCTVTRACWISLFPLNLTATTFSETWPQNRSVSQQNLKASSSLSLISRLAFKRCAVVQLHHVPSPSNDHNWSPNVYQHKDAYMQEVGNGGGSGSYS